MAKRKRRKRLPKDVVIVPDAVAQGVFKKLEELRKRGKIK